MESRVTHKAPASSLDSWDMENLKYLKKISKSNPQTIIPSGMVTCSSNPRGGGRKAGTDCESGTFTYNSSGSGSHCTEICETSDQELFVQDAERTEAEFHNSHVQKSLVSLAAKSKKDDNNNNEISLVAPLDTCYLLDVVTVRNESVLAVRHPAVQPKLGSDGSSSAGSSIEEGNFFDDVPEPMPEFGKSAGRYSRARSRTSSESNTLIEQESRRSTFKSPCPYCENGMMMANDFYFLGQKPNFVETSLVPTVGGECPPELPRTPSPYYVRLRRDLVAYTPSLRQPRNFGMDKQGQLLIDYSPNWDGLEKYVRNLKRC